MSAQALTQAEIRLQQLDRAGDQVAEVDHAAPLQAFLVRLVGGGEDAQAVTRAGFGGQQQPLRVGRMLAKQARTEAVKRGYPRLAVVVVQTLVDTPGDLGRGTV